MRDWKAAIVGWEAIPCGPAVLGANDGLLSNLGYIVDRVVSCKFNAGEMIFSEGDPCPGLWVIESGKVKIFKSAASGREQILTFEGPGSSVAELPVFDGGDYPASATAVVESRLLFVSKEDFRLLCLKCPEVAEGLACAVGLGTRNHTRPAQSRVP